MKAKTGITIILLAFVAASAFYLVIKELGSKSTCPVSPWMNEKSTSTTIAPQTSTVSGENTVTPTQQTAKQTVDTEKRPQSPVTSDKKVSRRKVVVYYFHGNMRCMTCRSIEAYTKEAIDTGFSEVLKDDRLEWQVINVEESGNEHFTQDFQLVTRSVVIAEFVDGKRTRWKNLQRVWELVRNKGAFLKYVQDETRAYLEDSGQ